MGDEKSVMLGVWWILKTTFSLRFKFSQGVDHELNQVNFFIKKL